MNGKSIAGVSGVFIEAKEPKALADWYSRAFGLTFNYWPERKSYGTEFVYDEGRGPHGRRSTVFVIDPADTARRHAPGFKVQFLVASVQRAKAAIEKSGTSVATEEHAYGNVAHLHDPEGNAVELWEPR